MSKSISYVKIVQISLDIAIPESLTSGDVEKFISEKVTKFIHKKTDLVVLNGIYECEDITDAYDLDEINETP